MYLLSRAGQIPRFRDFEVCLTLKRIAQGLLVVGVARFKYRLSVGRSIDPSIRNSFKREREVII